MNSGKKGKSSYMYSSRSRRLETKPLPHPHHHSHHHGSGSKRQRKIKKPSFQMRSQSVFLRSHLIAKANTKLERAPQQPNNNPETAGSRDIYGEGNGGNAATGGENGAGGLVGQEGELSPPPPGFVKHHTRRPKYDYGPLEVRGKLKPLDFPVFGRGAGFPSRAKSPGFDPPGRPPWNFERIVVSTEPPQLAYGESVPPASPEMATFSSSRVLDSYTGELMRPRTVDLSMSSRWRSLRAKGDDADRQEVEHLDIFEQHNLKKPAQRCY